MNQFIKQLTGVRFIAAFWVMLYHYQPAFLTAGILVPVVHEILRVGSLGVDLFFTLSGFILTHTYLTKLGPKLAGRSAGHFLWLRLARIYPVHFVMLNVAGLAVVAGDLLGSADASARSWLNPVSYIKQLLLIQEWGPDPSRGWNFVAWSLSMEWLAYLFFPLVALVLWRLRDRLSTLALGVIAFLCLTPLLWIGFTNSDDPFLIQGWSSSVRVLTEFIAGAFVYLVVQRLAADGGPSRQVSRVALIMSWAIPLAIVLISIGLGNIHALQFTGMGLPQDGGFEAPRFYIVIIPFLVAWIGALALSDRGPTSFLSTRRMVLGGFISYSLYMVHIVWYGLWRNGMSAVGIRSGPLYLLGTIGLVVCAVLFAYLMWRFVEEPAREWLRSKIGERKVPVEEKSMGVEIGASSAGSSSTAATVAATGPSAHAASTATSDTNISSSSDAGSGEGADQSAASGSEQSSSMPDQKAEPDQNSGFEERSSEPQGATGPGAGVGSAPSTGSAPGTE